MTLSYIFSSFPKQVLETMMCVLISFIILHFPKWTKLRIQYIGLYVRLLMTFDKKPLGKSFCPGWFLNQANKGRLEIEILQWTTTKVKYNSLRMNFWSRSSLIQLLMWLPGCWFSLHLQAAGFHSYPKTRGRGSKIGKS